MKLSLPSVVGVALLIVGVFAGVVLVQSEQDVRNKAAELREHKVVICHKTASDTNSWNQIEISENGVDSHLSHGDIRGGCPGGQDNGGKDKNDNGGNKGTNDKNITRTTIGENVTINNETTKTITDTKDQEIKYIYVNSRVDIWTKLFGIDKKVANKKYRVMFRSGEELHVFNNVTAVPDPKGVFKSTITDTRLGTFDVLIKPDGYLQKKFVNMNLARGVNRFRFEETPFIPGDFDGNNVLDSRDVAELTSLITDYPYPEVTDKEVFDVNTDGKIDNDDLNLVLEFYNGLEIYGDE